MSANNSFRAPQSQDESARKTLHERPQDVETLKPSPAGDIDTLNAAATDPQRDIATQVLDPDHTLVFDPNATLHEAAGAPRPADAVQDEEGMLLGDYRLLGPIARGGMGVVYKARQVKLGRLVALKMILFGDTASEEDRRRFQAEAEAAARLDHPGIVPIYDVGEFGGQPYFSMALVDGGSLASRIARTPLESREAARLMGQVAAAVEYAHHQGIVHRDLKPGNILLTRDGQPKVTDFGLAKRLELANGLTASGQVLGTPQYMPPEQAQGRMDEVGPLADVYSMGAILYHVLCGRPPFQAANSVAILRQVIDAEPVPPRRLNPAVDPDLETITLKCLEKDRHRRYSSAAALGNDLQRFLNGETILARPTPPLARAWKWSKRRPALALLALVSIIALFSMAIGGVLYAKFAQQRALLAEKELRDRKLLEQSRREVEVLLARGQHSLATDNAQDAQVFVERALATLGDSASFHPERNAALELRRQVEAQLVRHRRRDETRQRLADFGRHREAALFYGSQSFGLDPRHNQDLAAREAAAALALFGRQERDSSKLDLSDDFTTEEGRLLGEQCYELLLVRAEALVRASDQSTENQQALNEALALIDQAVALRGRATQAARLQRAFCLSGLGQRGAEEERAAAENAAAAPETAIDFFLLGKLQLSGVASGALSEACTSFEQALRIDPSHFWSQYCLAMCQLRLGKAALAQAHLMACAARRPDFAWIYILRGSARSVLGDFDLSESDYRRALALQPDDEARHVTLVNWGVLEYQRGNFRESQRLLNEAIVLRPAAYQAHLSLAKALERQGKGDEARAALDTAVALERQLPIAYRERARFFLERRDFASAEADLISAIDHEPAATPQKADDLTRLGELYFRQGRLQDSIARFDAAITSEPGYAPAYLWRAATLVEANRHQEALKSFDAYLKRGVPTLEFYLARGMCRASLANYVEAIDDFSRAIDIQPSADTYVKRGWVYALRGNPLFGLQDFDRALGLSPKAADAHCGRGLVLARMGRHGDAVAEAEASVRLDPSSPQNVYKAATIYAVAFPRVTPDQGMTSGALSDLRMRYLRRACELIEQAVLLEPEERRGEFWRSIVQSDVQLAPLANSLQFQKMRDRLDTLSRLPGDSR